jgi:hypothetical protein
MRIFCSSSTPWRAERRKDVASRIIEPSTGGPPPLLNILR